MLVVSALHAAAAWGWLAGCLQPQLSSRTHPDAVCFLWGSPQLGLHSHSYLIAAVWLLLRLSCTRLQAPGSPVALHKAVWSTRSPTTGGRFFTLYNSQRTLYVRAACMLLPQ